jgi:hypothetical protein
MRKTRPFWNQWRHIRGAKYTASNALYAECRDLPLDWDHYQDFEDYILGELGYPQPDQQLARISKELGWTAGNLEWRTRKEIGQTLKTCVYRTYRGRTWTIKRFAEHYGVDYCLLRERLNRGWPIAVAIRTPPEIKRRHAQ